MASTRSRPSIATTRPKETAKELSALAQVRSGERRAPPQVPPLAPALARAPRQVPQRERQVPPLVGQREPQARAPREPRILRAPPLARAPRQVPQRERPLPLVSKRSRQCSLRGCQGRVRARAATTPRKSLRLKVRCRRAPSPLRSQAT